jgi:hypothetical protein
LLAKLYLGGSGSTVIEGLIRQYVTERLRVTLLNDER